MRDSSSVLTQELQTRLDKFLASDPCTRWKTPRDGEENVELILEVTVLAQEHNVTTETLAQDWFKVKHT